MLTPFVRFVPSVSYPASSTAGIIPTPAGGFRRKVPTPDSPVGLCAAQSAAPGRTPPPAIGSRDFWRTPMPAGAILRQLPASGAKSLLPGPGDGSCTAYWAGNPRRAASDLSGTAFSSCSGGGNSCLAASRPCAADNELPSQPAGGLRRMESLPTP